jgi:DNA mismatch repair protein MutL
MPDIIHLLPDSVANQIAAGEVIQRPSSAVKELLENSVDSGADDIKLFIKDSGKTLIQIVDNGCGMSETDARMSFERHATSKIKTANDLFAIKSLGFRGEALASVAAIAQIELKTKRTEDETATCIQIEGSRVIGQAPCAHQNGTSIVVKNLFYNIPARRKFLKSDTTELRHIIEEFQRVALVYPAIRFSFFNEGRQLFLLNKSNLRQRISAIFGASYNNRLVPVEQGTEVVKISGFVGKPEFARKTRGEQYFFVNGRFIKHPYLNHAVDNAYYELIPKDAYPSYFIYFDINPEEIDINIHPTKTEISFQHNQVIYSILSASIKQSLGKFSLAPSLDFKNEPSVDFYPVKAGRDLRPPEIKINPDFNPFETIKTRASGTDDGQFKKHVSGNWQKLYQTGELKFQPATSHKSDIFAQPQELPGNDVPTAPPGDQFIQLQNKYLVASIKSGLMIIDSERANERILYEKFYNSAGSGKGLSQQLLFPVTFGFSPGDFEILNQLINDLHILGFILENFGDNSVIVHGIPVDLNNNDLKDVLEGIIENFKLNRKELDMDKKINLARSMAKNLAVRFRNKLKHEEMLMLINRLFACQVPEITPDGKPVISLLTIEEMNERFK